MSYVDRNLLPNEQVMYRARLSRIIYFAPVCLLMLAIVAVIAAIAASPGTVTHVWLGAAAVLACVGIILLVPRWIQSASSEFAVTNKRVLIKVGLVRRHSLELLLQKVEGIGVDQSVLGRMLGYGTITVSGTGGTREQFRLIARPLEFRRQVQANLSS